MQGDPSTPISIQDELGFLSAPLSGVGVDSTIEQDRRSAVAEFMLRRHTFGQKVPLVVVSGLTGSGVSTVVNSLAMVEVSDVGVRRPTTTTPVIVVDEDDLDGPEASLVLAIDGAPAVVEAVGVPFTVVDTPAWEMGASGDVAARLIPIADVVVYVTTPARYADAGGWRLIETAINADVPVVIVLNRPASGPLDDLKRRIGELYGSLGPRVIGGIDRMAIIEAINLAVAESPLRTIDHARSRLEGVVDRVAPLVEEAAVLTATAEDVYGAQAAVLADDLRRGDLVAAASLDSLTDASFEFASVITSRIGVAAERSATAWAATQMGAAALASDSVGLWRHGTETATLSQRHVAETIDDIRVVVRDTTKWRRPSERRLSMASDYLWRAALGNDRPTWSVKRAFGDRRLEAVEAVRELFCAAVARVFNADRQRFVERLNHIPTRQRLETLRLALAEEVPSKPPVSDTLDFAITIDITDGPDLAAAEPGHAASVGKTTQTNDA
ncbi:hypothetical protein MNBD_ACTINO02-475 [hydrothermal vent metagenome]|uniref:G domain-containing protein n=1 Tax=hydrothermal vent metagenome TaxID=652676 RepID=A0A3B0S5A2_9ZZZZ